MNLHLSVIILITFDMISGVVKFTFNHFSFILFVKMSTDRPHRHTQTRTKLLLKYNTRNITIMSKMWKS